MKMKSIMQVAWNIAKKGAKKFGGKATDYIAESMKMAWAMYKNTLAKKGGDIAVIADWFLKKNFDTSVIAQIKQSPLTIKKATAKANLIKVSVLENGKELDSFDFWAPKSVCM
jgi:hypothetical protein